MKLPISCITCTINTETSGKSEVSESLDVTLYASTGRAGATSLAVVEHNTERSYIAGVAVV